MPAAAYRQYTRSLLGALNWRGTWPPSDSVELGDVGVLKDGVFEAETTLGDLGVNFSGNQGRAKASVDYQSSSGVSVRTKLAGETSPYFTHVGRGRAGVLFRFSRRGAVVFSAVSCQIVGIEGMASLQAKLRRLRRSGEWHRHWVFVHRTIHASSATILVAGSRSAGVELRADASVTAIDLARIGAGLAVARREGMEVAMVATGDVMPLYQVKEPPR
jgi:hypothetical protein